MFTREECIEEGQVCSVEGGSAQWSNRQVHLVTQVHVVHERLPEIMKEGGIRLRSRIKINKCVSEYIGTGTGHLTVYHHGISPGKKE